MLVRMMSPHDDPPHQSRTTASFERGTQNGRTRGVRVVADYRRDSVFIRQETIGEDWSWNQW